MEQRDIERLRRKLELQRHEARQFLREYEQEAQSLDDKGKQQSADQCVSSMSKESLSERSSQRLTVLESGLAISEIPDDSKTGNPAQAPNRTGSPTIRAPESVRLLDVSDPAHPRTVQMFDGVTSIVRDDARNLIYLANADGIWILSHNQVLRRHLCSSSDAISSAIPNCD